MSAPPEDLISQDSDTDDVTDTDAPLQVGLPSYESLIVSPTSRSDFTRAVLGARFQLTVKNKTGVRLNDPWHSVSHILHNCVHDARARRLLLATICVMSKRQYIESSSHIRWIFDGSVYWEIDEPRRCDMGAYNLNTSGVFHRGKDEVRFMSSGYASVYDRTPKTLLGHVEFHVSDAYDFMRQVGLRVRKNKLILGLPEGCQSSDEDGDQE
ncbi:TPA_asm: hypothetical protein [Metorhabdovirus 2]|nr:TPA_asm: hypothetical protein [Metorhabdovirus 2]